LPSKKGRSNVTYPVRERVKLNKPPRGLLGQVHKLPTQL
jgi:hypothetical protein